LNVRLGECAGIEQAQELALVVGDQRAEESLAQRAEKRVAVLRARVGVVAAAASGDYRGSHVV